MRSWRSLALTVALVFGAQGLEGCASTRPAAERSSKKRGKRPPSGALAQATQEADDAEADRLQDGLASGEVELTDSVDEGLVSYYHDSLEGNPTANGERYRLSGATCAHKTLPFGTIVVIEDTATGKLATCRVNDRGPFVKGRVLDVSRRVARDLGLIERGVIRARLRLILPKAA